METWGDPTASNYMYLNDNIMSVQEQEQFKSRVINRARQVANDICNGCQPVNYDIDFYYNFCGGCPSGDFLSPVVKVTYHKRCK